MDHQTLTALLRELVPIDYTWKFCPYKAKKGRDGVEIESFCCDLYNTASFVEQLKETMLTKSIVERSVMPYTPFLSLKETIASVSCDDEYIKEQVSDFVLSMKSVEPSSPDDFVSGMLPAMTGYAFFGTKTTPQQGSGEPVQTAQSDEMATVDTDPADTAPQEDSGEPIQTPQLDEMEAVDTVLADGVLADEVLATLPDNLPVVFIRRTNPLVNSAKMALCTPKENGISDEQVPVFKITQNADLLIIGGVCYFLSDACPKDFGMENRHFAICQKQMGEIAKAGVVNDYEQLESVAMNAKHVRKFLDFDLDILAYIERLPTLERAEFLEKHGIVIDEKGCMDTYDPEQCELIIDLLCCRSCHDALGRLSVGSNIIPR